MNRFTYAKGKIRCPSCEKFIHPVKQAEEIYHSPSGHHYHKSPFCRGGVLSPPRLRYVSHSRKGRADRQAKATYY